MGGRISNWQGRLRRVALCIGLSAAVASAQGARPPASDPPQPARPEAPRAAHLSDQPELDAGFHLLYELKFPEARERFAEWENAHAGDPLGPAAQAAGYLFEEFDRKGVLTSEFFLDDKRLLGGIPGKPDRDLRSAFTSEDERAEQLARARLRSNPRDPDALFALTIALGMRADYLSLIEKRHVESLRLIRQAEDVAKDLLAVAPDAADAYLALGAANYIIGCLPGYKRFFLWFGGIHGDKAGGMQQLELTAEHGHYLRPFAKMMLALAALRENRVELARTEFEQLAAEFPQNPIVARELAKLRHPSSIASTSKSPEL